LKDLRSRETYCKAAIDFTKYLAVSSERISEFVKSKNASDIIEALRYFKRAVNFSLKDSAKHLRRFDDLIV